MDDTYLINVAKTEFREGYNRGDVDQVLSVFKDDGFTDMSEGGPSCFRERATEALRERLTELFAGYSVKLAVIIIDIAILGNAAYDFGWHELILKPKAGGETIRKRHRYFELWEKNASGDWKISFFIDNSDVAEEMAGQVSHWFLSEEHRDQGGAPAGS